MATSSIKRNFVIEGQDAIDFANSLDEAFKERDERGQYKFTGRVLSEEEKKEIENLKNKPDELLQSLIKLKAENLELHNQLKDITIECNQLLRKTKKKKKRVTHIIKN